MSSVTVPPEPILNAEVAAMVKEIGKVGPRVPEVARRLGRHKETVRYWYRKIEEHNFGIQAELNQEFLGLRRVIFTVKFGEEYESYIQPLMSAMADLCYLVGFSKSMPGDTYVLNASVPTERTNEYLGFFEKLKGQGIFTEVDATVYDEFRNRPMRTDCYDFIRGAWDFDAAQLQGASPPEDIKPLSRQKFDRIDLLLAKELSIDARREMRDIQKSIWDVDNVDINYKTLCWHLNEHVERSGLLRGYKVNWMGTQYDTASRRNLRPQHTYTGSELFVRGPTAEELTALREATAALPTVWSEAVGRDYHAQIAIPNELFLETLERIESAIRPVREKSSFLMVDMRHSNQFTIPYKLYEEDSKSWQFNEEDLLVKFNDFMVRVKNAS